METGQQVGAFIFVTLFFLVPIAAGLLAWRHLRAGRGDRKGAARLAIYVFVIMTGAWIFTADHVLSFAEWALVTRAFGSAVGSAVVCWILYLAIEPYVRRHWPHAMISWTRVLAGRFRDPLVGRDILFGCLSGVVITLVFPLGRLLVPLTGVPPARPGLNADADLLRGGRYIAGGLFDAQTEIGVFIGAFVLLLLLRIVLRRPWVANGAFVLVTFGLFTGFSFAEPTWIVGQWGRFQDVM